MVGVFSAVVEVSCLAFSLRWRSRTVEDKETSSRVDSDLRQERQRPQTARQRKQAEKDARIKEEDKDKDWRD